MSLPLDGLTILDLTRLLPGPFATLYLADLGATVVKVEDNKAGDYTRELDPGLFRMLNRNKQAVQLDLRSDTGRDALLALAQRADALLESFRPGTLDKMGLGVERLHAANPRLVVGSLTGYGQQGPYADWPGHDVNYLGYAGVLDQIGHRDAPPALSNLQIADLAGGALTFALGVVAALLDAQRTGQGRHVDVGMTDASLALMPVALAARQTTGQLPPRGEGMLSGGLPNYGVYACADGRHIALGTLEPKFWLGFCQAVQRPDLTRMPLSTGPDSQPLRDALAALFLSQPRDHWVALLADKGLCVGPVLNLDEALADPHMQSRGVYVETDDGGYIRCPINVGDTPPPLQPAPRRGADNPRWLGASTGTEGSN